MVNLLTSYVINSETASLLCDKGRACMCHLDTLVPEARLNVGHQDINCQF